MKMRHHLGAWTLAILLPAAAGADAAPHRLPWAAHSGLDFVQTTANANNYRGALGGKAMKMSQSADIREFGRMLWEDSIENQRRLWWVVNEEPPGAWLPYKVTPEYTFVIQQLDGAKGDEFDRRWIAQAFASLRDALALTQEYARIGDDFDLKEFASRSVPKLQMQFDRIAAIRMQHQQLVPR